MNDERRYQAIVFIVVIAGFFVACSRPQPEADSQSPCIADSVGTLRLRPSAPDCEFDWVCRATCFAGHGPACVALAYRLETNPSNAEETKRLYRRGCVLGEAIACTNYAAGIWAGNRSDAELTCARRTFEKACAASEPYACGMVGRLMIESTSPSVAAGHKHLEEACDNLGGFPCRVLAKQLEAGRLGAYDPKRIPILLTRACDGGDRDACGEPATAAETFR